MMVKSVSCCCVRGSRLFSDLVTYIGLFENIKANYRKRVIYWLKMLKYLPFLTDRELTLVSNEYIRIQKQLSQTFLYSLRDWEHDGA